MPARAARTRSISSAPRGTTRLTMASLGRLKKRFSIGFSTINTARIRTVGKTASKYCPVPAAIPMPAARTRAITSRNIGSNAFGTALWYCRAAPSGKERLRGGEEVVVEGLDVRIEGRPPTLGEQGLLDGEKGVHQLRDPHLNL